MSPNLLGYAPVHEIRALPSVSKGASERSCGPRAVSAVPMVDQYQFLYWKVPRFPAAADTDSRSQSAGRARAGRAAFKGPAARAAQGRAAGPDRTGPALPATRTSRGRDSTASWARCVQSLAARCGDMGAARSSRFLASAPLLSPLCPKPSVEAGAPSGRRPRPRLRKGSEGSPRSKGSTWLGLYECVHE